MMKHLISILLLLGTFSLGACSSLNENTNEANVSNSHAASTDLTSLSKAYFASGCFWCVEAIFESVEGVSEAISGYAGGKEKNPTYRQVSAGMTGHTEAVEVYYDPAVVSYETLVKVYYGSHDPTTVNGQHPDYGRQYRSVIFYTNDEEKKIAEDFKAQLDASGQYSKPIATEIVPHEKFWPAEAYHQNYEKNNPNQSYVRSVSIPRLKRFQAKFPELLKEGH